MAGTFNLMGTLVKGRFAQKCDFPSVVVHYAHVRHSQIQANTLNTAIPSHFSAIKSMHFDLTHGGCALAISFAIHCLSVMVFVCYRPRWFFGATLTVHTIYHPFTPPPPSPTSLVHILLVCVCDTTLCVCYQRMLPKFSDSFFGQFGSGEKLK